MKLVRDLSDFNEVKLPENITLEIYDTDSKKFNFYEKSKILAGTRDEYTRFHTIPADKVSQIMIYKDGNPIGFFDIVFGNFLGSLGLNRKYVKEEEFNEHKKLLIEQALSYMKSHNQEKAYFISSREEFGFVKAEDQQLEVFKEIRNKLKTELNSDLVD